MDQKKRQAKGKSKGGWNTKIHLVTDAIGLCLRWVLSPGNRNDICYARKAVGNLKIGRLLADRGYDSKDFREWLAIRAVQSVIPGRKNLKTPIIYDKEVYKRRHRVENIFSRMKQWSSLALRREKNDVTFGAMIDLFCMKDILKNCTG